MNVVSQFFDKLGEDILIYTWQHVYLTLVALVIAIILAVPTGIYLARTRWKKLASAVLGLAGVVQTVPTLALIAFMVLLFALVRELSGVRLQIVGFLPGLLALVVYALLPILRNTYTGIRQVDPSIVEVARGMGMTPRQVLFRVELPLSLPVIMAGIRIATVWTIGIAMLCGLIGAGGLGELIFRGLRSLPRTTDYLVAGTLPAIGLALMLDWILGRIERWLTPAGLEGRRTPT
ncbi:MAG: ABC transporter permease [Planctomycetota bacterium]